MIRLLLAFFLVNLTISGAKAADDTASCKESCLSSFKECRQFQRDRVDSGEVTDIKPRFWAKIKLIQTICKKERSDCMEDCSEK